MFKLAADDVSHAPYFGEEVPYFTKPAGHGLKTVTLFFDVVMLVVAHGFSLISKGEELYAPPLLWYWEAATSNLLLRSNILTIYPASSDSCPDAVLSCLTGFLSCQVLKMLVSLV